ncbi:hypothetical protein ACFV9G_23000 [Nocardioides sp. NPDC059952]|uniref:hypothetical protein n=1 Tax=Nocardioides sp. NPDC059952 TaxID=3347014 RepID=UPI00366210EC
MRAIQRAIVGVGLAVVALVAMALLIGGIRSTGPDQSSRPAAQAIGSQNRLGDGPTVPPEPIDAAEDTSVGTLPPPADASLATQLASRDLLAPPESAPNVQRPAEGTPLSARKSRPGEKPGQVPSMPGQDFTATQDGWDWSAWADADGWYGDRDDSDDCRREHRYEQRDDRRTDCDDDDRRD